jgi:hypothetical protein
MDNILGNRHCCDADTWSPVLYMAGHHCQPNFTGGSTAKRLKGGFQWLEELPIIIAFQELLIRLWLEPSPAQRQSLLITAQKS